MAAKAGLEVIDAGHLRYHFTYHSLVEMFHLLKACSELGSVDEELQVSLWKDFLKVVEEVAEEEDKAPDGRFIERNVIFHVHGRKS